jgi:hypothetical protein
MTRSAWIELLTLTAVAAVLAASVPLHAGLWTWSWDALNHHIYLGYIAESSRWHLDVVAASVQSWQYPYLYWPVYRLSLLDIGGSNAGAIWGAGLAAGLLPPVWLTSKHLLPSVSGAAVQSVFERVAACVLAASSVVVLSAIGTTANDPLAILPMLWSVAIMSVPMPGDRRAFAAAALWGASAAFKLSNGLFLPLLMLWWWVAEKPHLPLRRGALLAVGAALGFVVVYAPWGWQLWRVTGNPFYPFFAGMFGR